MFRSLIVIATLLTAVLSASAQSGGSASELEALLKWFLVGASRNDPDVHDRFWSEDLIYTRSSGTRISKDELMRGVRSTPVVPEGRAATVYTAEDIRIRLYGAVAVVAFRLAGATDTRDGRREVKHFINTGTFVKRKGKWRAVAWQSTAVPQS